MRAVRLASLTLLLVACTSPESDGKATERRSDPPNRPGLTHTPEEAANFIRRFEGMSVGLVNYFNPSKVELVSRAFTAETVVFRLNATGDTGPFHEAAAEIAAELADLMWQDTSASQETVQEGHLALIRIESLGVPSSARAGDAIPVRVRLKGNASDIHGGYLYATPLRNKLGREVAVLREGYLPFDVTRMPAQDVTSEMIEDARNLERRESAAGTWFVLRNSVRLSADVRTDDLTSDQIILPLERIVADRSGEWTVRSISTETVSDVVDDVTRQLKEQGIGVKVEHEPGKLIITPLGVRELTLQQVYERVKELRVDIRPRNRIIIVFDEQLHRVAIYGPVAQRLLLGDVALGAGYQLPFRVSCRVLERANAGRSGKYGIADAADQARGTTPDGNKGRVRLAWSRWREGKRVAEDTEEVATTDISEILRHLWVRGMGPGEALAFLIEADASLAINAELGFNYKKRDIEAMAQPAD